MRQFFLGVFSYLLIIITSTQAMACSCAAIEVETIPQIADTASAIFSGTVNKIETVSERTDDNDLTYTLKRIHFTVHQAWKGVENDTFTIETEIGPCCICIGYEFSTDSDYLVFAEGNPPSVPSLCGGTNILDEKKEYLGWQFIEKLGKPAITFESVQ